MTTSNPAPAESLRATPTAQGYRVELPEFEGPLDLLLHLIQKHELNILDIPIAFIAEQYVAYVHLMQDLSIDVASEYLVMAATLAHIKSRMLLPPEAVASDDTDTLPEEEGDPRAELTRRLLEYQKYKQAAEQLAQRGWLGRDFFGRGLGLDVSPQLAPLAQVSLFRLIDAFQAVIQRAHRSAEHVVDFERISVSDKIGQISDLLRLQPRIQFEGLFINDTSKVDMIVTLLALLEMTKLRMTRLVQEDDLGPIWVELAVVEDVQPEEPEEIVA